MSKLQDIVQHYVQELSGTRSEDASHSLVELGPAALPHIVQAFESTSDVNLAVPLIQVVSEYGSALALPFLTGLLQDDDAEVWKTTLDGLVNIGGNSVLEILRRILAFSGAEKRSWIEEAIDQIGETPE